MDNVNQYLGSKEESDVKIEYLVKAQSIADKYNLVIKGENTSILAKATNSYGGIKTNDKIFRLYNGKKSSSKRDIEFYKGEVEKIRFPQIVVPYKAQQYINILEAGKNIKKTKTGRIPSNETSTRKAFMIDAKNYVDNETFEGEFMEVSQKYMLAFVDIEDKFVKNEIAEDTRGYQNYGNLSDAFPLLKKKGTEEYYYILNNAFIPGLYDSQKANEIVMMVNKLGYKEYKSKDPYGEDKNLYIKSKTAEIRLDNEIFFKLKENPNYIVQLDNDQMQIASLVNQTIPHIKNLEKYSSLYNIQRRRMSTANINAWKNATSKALPLFNKISDLKEKYETNYSFTLLNKSKTWNEFVDYVTISRGILGM